ncbi:Mycothiol maleylpyruvate isomerase N-terminal domain-containing protein [Pedococcus dokdonensis]|uniref:Mycothiol maleylpyruvate isomerase N-terminal domain-containing protein n=1 Tax=Pedococcus dokdonensis TaxID=443156 RepID=A0A1H0LSP3_9MICO|nr:maleylpyruvate isomerase N-terminal domain-containing protein [Pedococcus dokdonensis]SDO71144.1 Mycothiol maleylpyruvate isomerase N-terminal domain-containing protein [Pedococcus dokdonensis]
MSRSEHVAAFLSAVDLSLELAARPEVGDAWERESSCAGMTVGGLTHHLLGQARNSVGLLQAQLPASAPVIRLAEHYERASWVRDSQNGQPDPEQTDQDNEGALAGHAAVLAAGAAAAQALPGLLAEPRDPDVVFISWQGWALPTHDYLTTRMMEMVVHGDDLASSVGLDSPSYPDGVAGPVLELLTGVAVRRHGLTDVVRALSRPQRAPRSISAF